MVPEIASRAAGIARARGVCVERFSGKIRRGADYLQGLRDLELGVGSGREVLLLASLLFASAGSQLRQSGRARSCPESARFLARNGGRRIEAGRGPVSLRTRRDELRKSA